MIMRDLFLSHNISTICCKYAKKLALDEYIFWILKLKNFIAPFNGYGSTASRIQGHYKEAVWF